MKIRNLVLTTDFSDRARDAYGAACSLARQFDACVHLVHEAESLLPVYLETITTDLGVTTFYRKRKEELAREAELPVFEGLKVEPRLLYPGDSCRTLQQFLEHEPADLVVISTHGHSGPAHLLLGSYAANVARCSPVPVLIYRGSAEEPTFHPRSILLPYDFSENGAAAFPVANSLAAAYKSSVEVVNVLPSKHEIVYAGDAVPRTHERLQEHCKPLSARGPDFVVRTGTPSHEIVEQAATGNHDLIVMATHGHKGLGHLIFGSVTEKVLRLAPCSVLTVRPGKTGASTEDSATGSEEADAAAESSRGDRVPSSRR